MKGAQEKSEGLCSAVARGAEEYLWLLAHEFRCSACNAGLGTFPKSLLPYLLHHWPLMKLARVLSAAWMEKENSSQRVFLSSDSVFAFVLAIPMAHVACFFIPRTMKSSFYTKPCELHVTEKWKWKIVSGTKVTERSPVICWTYWEVHLVTFYFWTRTAGNFFVFDEGKLCSMFASLCYSIPHVQDQKSTANDDCNNMVGNLGYLDVLMVKIVKMDGFGSAAAHVQELSCEHFPSPRVL